MGCVSGVWRRGEGGVGRAVEIGSPDEMSWQSALNVKCELSLQAHLWKLVRAQIITPAHVRFDLPALCVTLFPSPACLICCVSCLQMSNIKEFLCLSEEKQEVYIAAAQKTSASLNRPPTRVSFKLFLFSARMPA